VKQHSTAFNKAISFISTSIDQVSGMNKPQKKFVKWLVEKWVMLPVRHNFLNSFRYGGGGYSGKSIRQQFGRKISYSGWFDIAFSSMQNKECIAAFAPGCIHKSGKKTYGIGRFWNILLSPCAVSKPGSITSIWPRLFFQT